MTGYSSTCPIPVYPVHPVGICRWAARKCHHGLTALHRANHARAKPVPICQCKLNEFPIKNNSFIDNSPIEDSTTIECLLKPAGSVLTQLLELGWCIKVRSSIFQHNPAHQIPVSVNDRTCAMIAG